VADVFCDDVRRKNIADVGFGSTRPDMNAEQMSG
jgi:hypothetical protein